MERKTNYKVLFGILISSIVLAIIYNMVSLSGIEFIRKPINSVSVDFNNGDNSRNIVKEIDLAQALFIFDSKLGSFIDARDQWEYSEGHISGAFNIPEFSFELHDTILSKFSKDSLLVIYCSGDDCDMSKRLADQLLKLGYNNSFVFTKGIEAWLEAELPIEKGKIK